MKKLVQFVFIFLAFVVLFSSCKKDPIPAPTDDDEINVVSQFVYDGMSAYYLWSDEMVNKKPSISDADPKKYFNNILYKTDIDNNWSWITDDVKSLVGGFAGKQTTFGYSLTFMPVNEEQTQFFAIVKYIYPNSPAEKAGINRLDLIGKVDGKNITGKISPEGYILFDNEEQFSANKTTTFSLYKITNNGIVPNKDVTASPEEIDTDPVVFHKVFTLGSKKIGYLFYTSYIANFNYRLHEVFTHFKQEGVTDLVLDLRYNGGGGVDAASYLVSLFAPEADVKNKTTLVKMKYNSFLNDYFDRRGGRDVAKLGEYREKDVQRGDILYKAAPNPLSANLNLSRVYVIATGGSASASELTTFCTRAIIGESNVIHIGGRTYGKYTASQTLHPFNEELGIAIYEESKLSSEKKNTLKNWAMQPIVGIYSDKNEQNFINPGYLEPNYSLKEGFGYIDYWKPLGDPKDVFLGQALHLITGDESYKPVQPKTTRSGQELQKVLETKENIMPLNLDNLKLTKEDFQKIRMLRN